LVAGAVGIAIGSINAAPNDSWFCAGGAYGATPGNGNGSFMDTTVIAAMAGSALGRANRGDVNADADMDVIAVDATDDMAYFFQGGNVAAFTVTALDAGGDPTEGVIADVTGEGDPDVVVVSGADGTVTVFAGDGTGMFADGVTFDAGNGPTGVAVADLNEDGVGDIIVSNGADNGVNVLLSDP
jgi:hypothetical protein